MKHIHFDVESDGFYGAYWACKDGSNCAVIAMIGDDPEDYMARSAVKWLLRLGVNILTMSPGKKDYGHHNYPLECIEKAIAWLKLHGNEKIGIAGASTTGTLALMAASLFDNISLTIAMTPSDFVWQGSCRAKRMAARNGQSRENHSFLTREIPCHTCRFAISILTIGA
ncbi:MAG: acyl-CoA thioester hydrolase/BAAT C-terminal domain-containing protein [Eubacterium sp.]